MSSRSSSRKREEIAQKSKKKATANSSDGSEDEAESEEEPENVSLSDDEDTSEVVKSSRKRGACSYNKAAFSMPDDISKLMNRVLCTACGKQLNPMNHGAVRKHPWLKVVTCKKCYKFLKSGPFTRDNEGIDEQCRWCGDGGRLYGCDYCHNCFCRSCIKRNLGRTEAAEMEEQSPKTKWKCYMCQPKKIKSLTDNCKKILDYIKGQEEKERQKEERAKQREKEKAEAAKQKKQSAQKVKETEVKQDKDRRTSLPAPKPKSSLDAKTEQGGKSMKENSKDCIVINDSPEKPAFRHATAKSHLPIYNQRPGDGVTDVKKSGNGITQVVVGPKPVLPVTTPYQNKFQQQQKQHPSLFGALTSKLPPVKSQVMNKPIVIGNTAEANDIQALKDQLVPFNVETHTEKLASLAQQLSLTMNSVKTDLAIAKLSSPNLFASRTQAAYTVKLGLDTFFNNIRSIFNVQVVTKHPDSENVIEIEDDKLTNGKDSGVENNVDGKKEAKCEEKEVDKKDDEDKKEEPEVKVEPKAELIKIEKSDLDNNEKTVNSEEPSEMDTDPGAENTDTDSKSDKEDCKKEKELEDNKSEKESDKDSGGDGAKQNKETEKNQKECDLNRTENSAAELDMLKELADGINESMERDESSDEEEVVERRRSSRRGKSQSLKSDEEESKASTETSTRKSSRNKKDQSEQKQSDDDDKKVSKKKVSDTDDSEKDIKSKSKEAVGSKKQKDSRDQKKASNDSADSDSEKDSEKETKNSKKDSKSSEKDDKKSNLESKSKVSDKKDTKNKSKTQENETKSKDVKQTEKKKGIKKDEESSSEERNETAPEADEVEEEEEEKEDEDEVSSDSDSSVSSAEFGKRKKRRKVNEKNQKDVAKDRKSKEKSKEKTSKSKKETIAKTDKKGKSPGSRGDGRKKKAVSDEDEKSDSSSFDSDLEKDIKSLSKDTKLQRRSTRAAAIKDTDKAADKKKTSKPSKKEKEKATTDEDESDVSNEDTDVEDGGDEQEEEDNDETEEENLTEEQLKKLKDRSKDNEDEDYEDMAASESESNSDDPEVSFPKLETPKKGKKKVKSEESEDSDFITPKKKKQKKLKDDLLDADLSDSDSDVGVKKKKKGRGKKRKKESTEEEPDPEDEVYSDDNKKKKGKGKRKRIRKIEDSSDEEKEQKEEEEEDEDGEEKGGAFKRKKIRKVMANKKLADSTKDARKAEDERRKRIAERQKEFNAYVEVEGGEEEDELPEGTERELKEKDKKDESSIAQILGSPKKIPVTTRCILDMDKETKKVLVEINRTLVRKLKPHQVEAVRFMYNCLVESIERLKKEEGAGCILAHCMGLGKTLSVITFLHTMLSNVKRTKMTKCLVVCPLNTVLNWVNEFEIWLEDVEYDIDIYEMSKVKQNYERAQLLREWHEGNSGVMILGYDMYRNLVMGNHCKNKKQKATFYETLADPGPDIVVCDEGHILKNDATSLSKAMNKIKSRRRVVLTGTPLQNNLGEYHCMVSFVKPNLLGTRKEFSNRFVNPITNGQCTDSSASDVKLMKRRAHILHEMLAGCVQRKDYSALTKFLPPKYEYVVAVRMGKLQCQLYERYLKEAGIIQNEEVQGKGGRLFRDYQALMRIWTHPWVMKLDEIRQENKRTYDSEDSFIDDDDEESDADSFISNSTTSESDNDDYKKKKSKGKRKTRNSRAQDSSSDSDVKVVNDENEVVKKWTSKTRGNEEGAGSSWMQDMGYSTGPKEVSEEWWAEYVKEEDEFKIELSGKLTLMFEILKMCEDIGDKVLVFSQSLLSLDIIEDFLHHIDESNKLEGEDGEKKEGESAMNGDEDKDGSSNKEEKKTDKYAEYGKSWTCGADYFRMDGSTNSQQRKAAQDSFNDPENYRARLFLISTKAGSLGINLVSANRVIIFDASWNPSHDIQSIFRVYRFGQVKPVYVYRFLAQGTMEEKIYERQVTKQSLSQRVVDEHQIERHFTANDLQELYKFQPDRLDDPDRKERPLPMLPKDHMLAELMGTQKDWIVTFHEHDSLLENIIEQELSEEEKKAAWEDYENDKKGLNTAYNMQYANMMSAQQRMNSALEFQNLVLQGQANLGQEVVLQIVQDLKTRFPNLPPEVFSQRVQAVLRQVLTQRIMQQNDYQRRQIDQQKMAELNRLNQIKQQIQQQQAMINSQQRGLGIQQNYGGSSLFGVQALPSSGFFNSVQRQSGSASSSSSSALASQLTQKSTSKGDKK